MEFTRVFCRVYTIGEKVEGKWIDEDTGTVEWLPAEIVTLPTPFKPLLKICWPKEACKNGEVFFEPLWVSKEKREYASSVQQQGKFGSETDWWSKRGQGTHSVTFPEGRLLAFGFIFLLPSP